MNQRVADKGEGGDEVDRPGRLPPAEKGQQDRRGGVDVGRHRQSGQENERPEDKGNAGIGDFLKDIVMGGLFPGGMAEEEMVPDRRSYLSKVLLLWNEIVPEMAACR